MIETAPKIIDKELALEQAGGNLDLANELFSMLLNELPQFDRGIRAAFERRDWETLRHSVHKLNGAAVYCGVPALKSAAERLEAQIKRGDTEVVATHVADLLKAILQVEDHAHLRLA